MFCTPFARHRTTRFWFAALLFGASVAGLPRIGCGWADEAAQNATKADSYAAAGTTTNRTNTTNSDSATTATGARMSTLAGKPFRTIQEEVRTVLRRESEGKSVADRTRAVYELIDLHRAIVADERFRTSDTMKGFRQQVASRLLAVQSEIQRKLHREQAEKPAKSAPGGRANVRASQPGRGGSNDNNSFAALADQPVPPTAEVTDSWSDLLALTGASQGGPLWLILEGSASGGRPGGPAVPGDWGPVLVDLIQRTIHPDFWDVQGGPGTIVYYAPLHCLVVRATAEVHGDVGVVIGGLRRVRP